MRRRNSASSALLTRKRLDHSLSAALAAEALELVRGATSVSNAQTPSPTGDRAEGKEQVVRHIFMFKPERMSDFVLKKPGETTKTEARRRSNRDDDGLSLAPPSLAPARATRADISAPPRALRSGHDEDSLRFANPQRGKPPGEERPEVSRVVSRPVGQGEPHDCRSPFSDADRVERSCDRPSAATCSCGPCPCHGEPCWSGASCS